jgi:hypothetical protein
MTAFEVREQYPTEVQFWIQEGERRAAALVKEEKRKRAARPKL